MTACRTGLPTGDRATRLKAIGFAVLGLALFSLADALMKHLSGLYPFVQNLFLNAVFSLVPITVMAFARGGVRSFRTTRPGLQVLRAALGLATGFLAVVSFYRMPMADTYAILFASPLIITAASAALFRERVEWQRWAAVFSGFFGILLMLHPDPLGFNIGAFGAIGSAACYSASALVVRHLGQGETAFSFPFYGNLLTVALFGPALPFVFVAPTLADLGLTALTGLLTGFALTALLFSFRIAPSAVVAPFQYSQMVWGVVLGWLLFGDVPDLRLAVGASVVIASGLYLLKREATAPRRMDAAE